MLKKLLLLFHTVKYLKLKQIVNQVLIKTIRKRGSIEWNARNISFSEYDVWIDELDGDEKYVERFLPEKLLNNKITLLSESRNFDTWHFDDSSHLWNFNVHYLEYLVALKARYKATNDNRYLDKLNEIFDWWYKEGIKDSDSQQSYTISLRIINLLIVADCIRAKNALYDCIYDQYKYLSMHQEIHLLGNHYLENLKALVICSVIFNENKNYSKYIKRLIKELDEEITDDGLHFELSLMYHKIILEDLIRIATILKGAQKQESSLVIEYIKKMTNALYSLEGGIDRTLLFNDSGEGVSKTTASLLEVVKKNFDIIPQKGQSISGYYRLDKNDISIIVDCGELSPKYMAGHSHCDCLSFELFLHGKPIFVNSGTYQYQGDFRKYFRSTSAHNTITINGHEQSELWGEHRAARRISSVKAILSPNEFRGEYKNYNKERHLREIRIEEGYVDIIDKADGLVKSYLHLASGLEYHEGVIFDEQPIFKIIPINARLEHISSVYSESFGTKTDNLTLIFEWENDKNEHGYRIETIGGNNYNG